jgi:hypothetical protein
MKHFDFPIVPPDGISVERRLLLDPAVSFPFVGLPVTSPAMPKRFPLLTFAVLAMAGWAIAVRLYWQRRHPTPPPAPAPNSIDATAALDWYNSRPVPPNAYRVLYIGDSLLIVGPTPGLWPRYCGMAATDTARDYLHITAAHIQRALAPRPVESLMDNGGNGKIAAMLEYLGHHPELKPDIVVLQGGENDPFDESFRQTYSKLMDLYHVPLIVLGDWWSTEKSAWESQQAVQRGGAFVNLVTINSLPSNSGYGGPFNNPDVARHPSDAGQDAIAQEVNEAFDRLRPAPVSSPSY